MRRTLLIALLLGGCKGKIVLPGAGPEPDGRLTADLWTWDCADASSVWMGVKGFDLTLEFTPDDLDSRDIPVGDCVAGVSEFAQDTLKHGAALVDEDGVEVSGDPTWATADDGGSMDPVVDGLWYDEAYHNLETCNRVSDVIHDGVTLGNAGILDGATTPEAGEVVGIDVSEDFTVDGIPFGATATLSWDAAGWDSSFVQMRRVKDDLAYETVTCNTTGEDGFDLDETMWDLLDEGIDVDRNLLVVAFVDETTVSVKTGQKVHVQTRALHEVGVNRQ